MQFTRKLNPRQEQRLRERERLDQAPSLAATFPQLKSLSVVLGYFDRQRGTHAGELRYRANVDHAKAVLSFSCPASGCQGGGFDLTNILLKAVTGKRKTAQGELHCGGKKVAVTKQETACQHLLHYKLTLSYA